MERSPRCRSVRLWSQRTRTTPENHLASPYPPCTRPRRASASRPELHPAKSCWWPSPPASLSRSVNLYLNTTYSLRECSSWAWADRLMLAWRLTPPPPKYGPVLRLDVAGGYGLRGYRVRRLRLVIARPPLICRSTARPRWCFLAIDLGVNGGD
jgi:hypothetical protein